MRVVTRLEDLRSLALVVPLPVNLGAASLGVVAAAVPKTGRLATPPVPEEAAGSFPPTMRTASQS